MDTIAPEARLLASPINPAHAMPSAGLRFSAPQPLEMGNVTAVSGVPWLKSVTFQQANSWKQCEAVGCVGVNRQCPWQADAMCALYDRGAGGRLL